MFGLGVLADHHCSVCVSPSHCQTRKSILFASLPWHPFLPRSGLFLSLYPSWHTPNGSNSACLFWVVRHPNRTPPRKSLSWNHKNRFFPSPHHQTMPCNPPISPCSVLAGYRLVVPGPCACLHSICVQNLLAAHSSAVIWRLVVRVFFPAPFKSWALFDDGSYISLAHSLVSFISCNVVLLFLP